MSTAIGIIVVISAIFVIGLGIVLANNEEVNKTQFEIADGPVNPPAPSQNSPYFSNRSIAVAKEYQSLGDAQLAAGAQISAGGNTVPDNYNSAINESLRPDLPSLGEVGRVIPEQQFPFPMVHKNWIPFFSSQRTYFPIASDEIAPLV